MRSNYLTMFAAAAAVSLSSFASAPASALPAAKPAITVKSDVVQARMHGGNQWRGNHWRGNRGGFHHRRFYGSRLFIAPSYGYRSYGNGCYWLKRKAINTGSRYWWNRYNSCRWG
jgi:hypothetical protein